MLIMLDQISRGCPWERLVHVVDQLRSKQHATVSWYAVARPSHTSPAALLGRQTAAAQADTAAPSGGQHPPGSTHPQQHPALSVQQPFAIQNRHSQAMPVKMA